MNIFAKLYIYNYHIKMLRTKSSKISTVLGTRLGQPKSPTFPLAQLTSISTISPNSEQSVWWLLRAHTDKFGQKEEEKEE